jgi:hypothetical protein
MDFILDRKLRPDWSFAEIEIKRFNKLYKIPNTFMLALVANINVRRSIYVLLYEVSRIYISFRVLSSRPHVSRFIGIRIATERLLKTLRRVPVRM